MTKPRVALLFTAIGLLAGCGVQPPVPPPPAAGVPDTAASAPEPTPAPAPPTGPVSVAAQQQAQKVALAAAGMLELGNEEQARAELQRALAVDPNNKLALNLTRQISADPVAALGRESFPYTVRPNDTLSGIAGRYLGDIYSFYILARYNDIKVPKQVAGGQTIRIPGKPRPEAKAPPPAPPAPVPAPAVAAPPVAAAPTPPAPPPPPPPPPEPTPGEKAMRSAEAAEKAGDLERARSEYLRAASLDQPGGTAKAEGVRQRQVSQYTLKARSAFARQDLDGAIAAWDRVLALDPGNNTAKLERQKALDLREKAKKL